MSAPSNRCGDPIIDRADDDAIKAIQTTARVALAVGHNYLDQGISFVIVTLRHDTKAARVDMTGSTRDVLHGLRAVLRDLEARVARVDEKTASEEELEDAIRVPPEKGGVA